MLDFIMRKSVFIYTYGCQMNVHDSEKMKGLLVDDGFGLAERPEDADLIIFNTCAIRQKAEQKFYSQLGRTKFMKRKNANVRIAVTGCVAQDSRDGIIRRAPFVDFVLGPQNLHRLCDMASGRSGGVMITDNPQIAVQEFLPQRDSALKAWVAIMYGCNNFCSYCIVPHTRGREVSRPSGSIVAEVADLKKKGYKEVTLLGQNVNSYHSDVDFPGLLVMIDATEIDRIRFVTSHPRDLSADLIDAMAGLSHVCEHLHLPLQSGADRILRLMNRGYTLDDFAGRVEALRKKVPGIAITTDIIVGFPGETAEEYKATARALSEIRFDGIFAFKYSPRRGTRAFSMEDQVPEDIKSHRLSELLRMQEEVSCMKNQLLEGTIQEVLVEGSSDNDPMVMTGRTRTNKIVNFTCSGDKVGLLVNVKIERAMQHILHGTLVAGSE